LIVTTGEDAEIHAGSVMASERMENEHRISRDLD
jgi:hypothetical protein